jgi:murein DD-endopeptidase MepM/ murein hydrolase activator NlpD
MRHPFSKKTITSRFGAIKGRVIPHRGLDYAPKEGTRIPAVSGGTVQVVKWSSILGWVLVQTAWDSINDKVVYIGYCHLQEQPKLKPGTVITQSQTVGKVGNTGSASKNAHLHLTIGPRVTSVTFGTVFDPEKFIDERLDA